MTHLVGIDKGPVMEWTNDSGLRERYRKWKKHVEVLFKGPLNNVAHGVKCNYIIYWSGDHGMDLVDKWTAEGKINDGNKEQLNTYWTQFENYIHPQTNQLIAVVELKRLFQGSLSLEDFHTKALRLVQQAGYEGDAKDRVLRDTIISGLASDKIRAKIVKEGHGVNLNRVMEIARLEVSTQQHLERMQETAKVNYIQYGKSTKSKKGKKPQSSAGASSHNTGAGSHRGSRPSGKFNKRPPLLPDTCYRCGKGRHQKAQDCKAVDTTCRGCGKKGHYEKVFLKENALHTLWRPHRPILQGLVNPYISMMRDNQCTLIWSVFPMLTVNKHLIKFPVALEPTTLKGNNTDSPQSTVLLKADTGADVNLMNNKTFNPLFGGAKEVLKPTPIKMENYGNTGVKVLGMFHAFLRWKDKVYRQLFYVTDCDRSPNLLSRDACYILGVLKPCYTVEKTTSKKTTTKTTSSPTVNASTNGDVVAKSFLHQKMNGSEKNTVQ